MSNSQTELNTLSSTSKNQLPETKIYTMELIEELCINTAIHGILLVIFKELIFSIVKNLPSYSTTENSKFT